MTAESKIAIPQEVLFQEVGGEAVLLNLANGKYYGLDEVGTRMWQLLGQFGAIEPTVNALLTEYEVTEAQLRNDLQKLVEELASHQLIEIHAA